MPRFDACAVCHADGGMRAAGCCGECDGTPVPAPTPLKPETPKRKRVREPRNTAHAAKMAATKRGERHIAEPPRFEVRPGETEREAHARHHREIDEWAERISTPLSKRPRA